MQHADCVPEVQPFSMPVGRRRPRVQAQAFGFIPRADHRRRIATYLRPTRDLRQKITVRPSEAKLAIRLSLDLKAFFVDAPMVTTTEQREVGERRGATIDPVLDVMALAEACPTAGEAAAAVAMVERPPDCRRNRAGPRADLEQSPIGVVAHHDPARVARQTLGRSGRNALPTLEH